jgi:hypothetical protein
MVIQLPGWRVFRIEVDGFHEKHQAEAALAEAVKGHPDLEGRLLEAGIGTTEAATALEAAQDVVLNEVKGDLEDIAACEDFGLAKVKLAELLGFLKTVTDGALVPDPAVTPRER